MVESTLIEPVNVPGLWSRVSDFIQNGLPKEVQLFDLSFVHEKLMTGEWRLAVATQADEIIGAVVLSYNIFQLCSTISIISLGGKDGKAWFDSMSDLIELTRETSGAKYTLFSGRDGWTKVRPEFQRMASVYYRGEA